MCVILHDSIAYLRVSSLKSDLMCSYLIKQNGTTRHVKYKYCQNYSILCFFLLRLGREAKDEQRKQSDVKGTGKGDGSGSHGGGRESHGGDSDRARRGSHDSDGPGHRGESQRAADTRRSHPGLPDPSNGPSTTITGSGGTPLAETADLLGLGGNGSGSPEESHDDVLSNKDPAVWTHGMFPHISASHPEA